MAGDDDNNDFLKTIEENRKRNKAIIEQSLEEFYKQYPEMKEEAEARKNDFKSQLPKELPRVGPRRKTLDPSFSVAGIKRSRKAVSMTPTRRSARLSGTEVSFNHENDSLADSASNTDSSDDEDAPRFGRKRGRVSLKPLSELKARRSTAGSRATKVPELPVEEVSDRLLAKIATNSRKEYCSVKGTTCHQCRQKTKDTKSVCRSGKCVGVRGMFCGVCLRNRYGEDVAEVLKDPNWSCPPCRNICNCSICRTRMGKMPTGQMVPFIREQGYTHLKEYLDKHPEDDE
ncbi:cell division cycle-associated protein 7 [Nilaparvata lugens]|uniref:cell division cycle-associated protein 7 n=1 Tax=Nilaparvata lugens TaxID=108931 RepID=UPI000B99BB01|nr:cell division cycle-associated protein 7 [Nilaparvata lugens]